MRNLFNPPVGGVPEKYPIKERLYEKGVNCTYRVKEFRRYIDEYTLR